MNKIICKQCGSVNAIDEPREDNDFVSSRLLEDFDWFMPMKKTTSSKGEPVYANQDGILMSREEYILKFNIDPEIAHAKMRSHIGMKLVD